MARPPVPPPVSASRRALGLVLGSGIPPERLRPTAARAEQLGFDELWFSEDCFFTGAISGATAALGATSRIAVGLGVVSGMLRQPALLSMEISTMARAFPARLSVGLGLGVPAWLRQLESLPRSPRTALTECVSAMRRLLAGERLEQTGEYFSFHDVALAHPPTDPVPVHLGVVGRRLLQLSGEIADGTILSVCAGPRYITWAREQIEAGRARASQQEAQRVTAFALYTVAHDGRAAFDAMRGPLAFFLAADPENDLIRVQGLSETIGELVTRGGPDALVAGMPASWPSELAVSGTPEDCAEQIRALYEAGADSVALLPVGDQPLDDMASLTAAEVMPLLAQGRGS
jgi:5,10-methylenetetrahydromethanopterin reductase